MFGNKKDKKEDLKIKVDNWFNSLKYLQKIEILLEGYPKLNITSIERQGIGNLWRTLSSLKGKALIMEIWENEHKKERR